MTDSKVSPPAVPSRRFLIKILSFATGFGILAILFTALYLAWLQYHSHQLWNIVSKRCVPEQSLHGVPAPCLKVSLTQRYTVFNDANGPLHTLLIPTDKISGIESSVLLGAKAENYFQYGWDTRYFLTQQAAFPVPDRYLALAVNSRYGRTQNQLHLHLACLKPEVYQTILQQKEHIGHQWQRLHVPLSGQRYQAIKVPATLNPFIALAQYVQLQDDKMDNYGLLRLAPDNGEVILLATRLHFTTFSLGTAEQLLDVDCKLARASG